MIEGEFNLAKYSNKWCGRNNSTWCNSMIRYELFRVDMLRVDYIKRNSLTQKTQLKSINRVFMQAIVATVSKPFVILNSIMKLFLILVVPYDWIFREYLSTTHYVLETSEKSIDLQRDSTTCLRAWLAPPT